MWNDKFFSVVGAVQDGSVVSRLSTPLRCNSCVYLCARCVALRITVRVVRCCGLRRLAAMRDGFHLGHLEHGFLQEVQGPA